MARDVEARAESLPFDAAPGGGGGEWEVLQSRRPAGRDPSPWLWVGGVGLAAVLLAVAVGFGGGDEAATPAQTSLAPPVTAVPPTSVAT
ncbi:MAG TPA: hypothetical protein VID93_04890, partial [Acidimicrobiales bacterium]